MKTIIFAVVTMIGFCASAAQEKYTCVGLNKKSDRFTNFVLTLKAVNGAASEGKPADYILEIAKPGVGYAKEEILVTAQVEDVSFVAKNEKKNVTLGIYLDELYSSYVLLPKSILTSPSGNNYQIQVLQNLHCF